MTGAQAAWRWGLALCLLSAGAGRVWAVTQKAPATTVTQLRCELVYLPQRHTWDRVLTLHHSRRRLQAVAVDGVPVHSFRLAGHTLLTSLDNERIQIDLDAGRWQSDLRGIVEGQGACVAEP
jgi:hypothetical protein